jgi:hypothetical protein
VHITLDHSSDSVSVVLYSTINGRSNDESWAFSDVQVFAIDSYSRGILIVPTVLKPKWADMLTLFYTDFLEDGTVDLDGWSSNKVLAYGWGTLTDEVSTKKESCEADSLPSCAQIHGPFDRDTKIISKTFSGLQNHTKLALTLRLWRVDSWDRTDECFVELFDVPENGPAPTKPFYMSTIAPNPTMWDDLSCVEPWEDYLTPTGDNGELVPGSIYQPWAGTRGAVCFNQQSHLLQHNKSSFRLQLRHTLNSLDTDEWFGFDDVKISLELSNPSNSGQVTTGGSSECPGSTCASMECQKAPGNKDTAMILGYCDPLTGCSDSIISSKKDRKTCEEWAVAAKSSTCVPPPVTIAPETNAGRCEICDSDFQCNRNAPFAPIHFIDPLRSNKSDPIKGRLVTKFEILSHGSLSAEAPENFAIFKMNGVELGQAYGVGPNNFGPRCNDCYSSLPLIISNSDFYSYAGDFNEGPGDGNNTVNFTVNDGVPWCISKVEIRICAKPGLPQIHKVHVVSGQAHTDDNPIPPIKFNNTELSPSGHEWIWFSGQNFLPSVDAVSYGPKGEGFVASNCSMYESGTLVRCLTAPGVGTQHNWKIYANGESNKIGADCLFGYTCNTTYASPEILSVTPENGPTNGGIQIIMNGIIT